MSAPARGPSAFSDSPEDLIAKALKLIDDAAVSGKTAIVMGDLARALDKERQAMAGRMASVRASNIAEGQMRSELEALKKSIAPAQLRLWRRVALGGWVGWGAMIAAAAWRHFFG